jgi:hypothetical protein
MDSVRQLAPAQQASPFESAPAPDAGRWEQVLAAGSHVPLLVAQFAPISLRALEDAALLDRVDIKYVMAASRLYAFLAALQDHYRILEITKRRLHRYQTLYYDTAEMGLYHLHHNGARVRAKVRSRRYADTGQAFLEVKLRESANRTTKYRLPVHGLPETLGPQMLGFAREHVRRPLPSLEPKIANAFYRLTLAHIKRPERVTIDLGLRMWGQIGSVALPGVAVIEIKQPEMARDSTARETLRAMGCRPSSFSKYCLGVTTLYSSVKHNTFQPEMRMLRTLTGESL